MCGIAKGSVSWLSGGKAAAAREKSAGREGGHAAVATRWLIAHLVRDFLNAVNESHLVKGIDQGRKATVHAENPAVDNRGDIHAVENIAARLPNRGAAVPAQRVIKMKDVSPISKLQHAMLFICIRTTGTYLRMHSS